MTGISLRLMVVSLAITMVVSWVYWISTPPDCVDDALQSRACGDDAAVDASTKQHAAYYRRGPAVRLDFANLTNFNQATGTAPADGQQELRRTWDRAQIYVMHGDITVFGRVGDANIQQRLSQVPTGVKIPTIIYLHDCVLPRWPGPYHFWVDLAQSGYVLIAPDGFARANNKPRTCDREHAQPELRLEELRFAIDQAITLPWIDRQNMFLIGHSEGGEAAGRYLGDAFKGIVITSASCSTRGRDEFATPLLAVASIRDNWLEGLGPYCQRADERLLMPGSGHGVLVYPEVQRVIRTFISRHTQVAVSKDHMSCGACTARHRSSTKSRERRQAARNDSATD